MPPLDPPPPVTVEFDHAQRRFSRDRIGLTCAGDDWDLAQASEGVWQDPVSGSLWLLPRCFDDAWTTSTAAPYDKLGFADFGNPAGLSMSDLTGTGGGLYLRGPKGTEIQTVAPMARNQGVVVSAFAYSSGGDGIRWELGWSASPGVESAIAARQYFDGRTQIWANGEKIAEGRITGGRSSDKKQNELIETLIFPGRGREILVVSRSGSGFSAILPDIEDGAVDPEILPAARLWVRSPDATTMLQIARARFHTSGHVCSLPYQLAEYPDGEDVRETFDNPLWAGGANKTWRIYGDRLGGAGGAGAEIVALDGSTEFEPDGGSRDCRLRLDLTGNGSSTPTVYAVEAAYANRSALTDATEISDVTKSLASFSIEVPDGGETKIDIEILDPQALAATTPQILTQYNRPVRILSGESTLMNGYSGPPKRRWRSTGPQAERLAVQVLDAVKELRAYIFGERKIFDGMYVCRASGPCVIRFLLKTIGKTDEGMDLEDADVRVGEVAPGECGDFVDSAEIGDSSWEIIERFMEDYLGGWSYAVEPSPDGAKFRVRSPETIDAQEPALTLYATHADAIADGIDELDAWRYVYRSIEEEIIENEANAVFVTGYDVRGRQPIQAVKRDAAAAEPSTKPSERPANWHGAPRKYGLINRGIGTQEIANGAAELIDERLSPARRLIKWESEAALADPTTGLWLWRGSKVTLDRIGDLLVASFSGQIVKDTRTVQQVEDDGEDPSVLDDPWHWRPMTYVGSNRLGTTGAKGLAGIAAAGRANNGRRAVQRRRSGAMTIQRLGKVVVIT